MKINYQLVCDEKIKELTGNGKRPRLLLHSCCGPCSSYVLEYLSAFFEITVLFFNPNIYPESEYEKRLSEQKKLIASMSFENPVTLFSIPYDYSEFLTSAYGFESEREGGARCTECFRLRLGRCAQIAKERGFDVFATTLSVSPHKNAALLNTIGAELSERYGVTYLPSDFKKKNGYKRSIELSKKYGIYRQEYCGCEFSLPHENRILSM